MSDTDGVSFPRPALHGQAMTSAHFRDFRGVRPPFSRSFASLSKTHPGFRLTGTAAFRGSIVRHTLHDTCNAAQQNAIHSMNEAHSQIYTIFGMISMHNHPIMRKNKPLWAGPAGRTAGRLGGPGREPDSDVSLLSSSGSPVFGQGEATANPHTMA